MCSKRVVFYYTISPLHMGGGTALGLVDNPIQRDVHTNYPKITASGIKGVFRWEARGHRISEEEERRIFGPEPSSGSSDHHAGSVLFTDAQILLFPVRSATCGYVYVTCPLALSQANRLLGVAKINQDGIPDVTLTDDRQAIFRGNDETLVIDTFWFTRQRNQNLQSLFDWAYNNLLPNTDAYQSFRNRIKNHLVIVTDKVFRYFIDNNMLIEPHVRIDDETGTAAEGALFYTENVPPETVFIGLIARNHLPGKSNNQAQSDIDLLTNRYNGEVLQFGGDSTTGRGMVVVNFLCNPS